MKAIDHTKTNEHIRLPIKTVLCIEQGDDNTIIVRTLVGNITYEHFFRCSVAIVFNHLKGDMNIW